MKNSALGTAVVLNVDFRDADAASSQACVMEWISISSVALATWIYHYNYKSVILTQGKESIWFHVCVA